MPEFWGCRQATGHRREYSIIYLLAHSSSRSVDAFDHSQNETRFVSWNRSAGRLSLTMNPYNILASCILNGTMTTDYGIPRLVLLRSDPGDNMFVADKNSCLMDPMTIFSTSCCRKAQDELLDRKIRIYGRVLLRPIGEHMLHDLLTPRSLRILSTAAGR